MNAKQFLEKHYYIQLRIETYLRRTDELRNLSVSTGSFRYDTDRVVVSLPVSSGFEDKVIMIADLDSDKQIEIMKLKEMRQRILNLIKDLPEKEKTLIEMRYLNHMKWQQVAAVMDYTEVHVKRMNSEILKELDEKYEFIDEK